MLVEPNLDRVLLAAALHRHYGLATSTLRFIPAGETAWCYQLTDERGSRWFLKLRRPATPEPARTRFALQLGGALADLGCPCPARDRPRQASCGAGWMDCGWSCSSSSTASRSATSS